MKFSSRETRFSLAHLPINVIENRLLLGSEKFLRNGQFHKLSKVSVQRAFGAIGRNDF
jgi:hypothetical protein